MEQKRVLPAKQIASDLKAGLSDEQLITKYSLTLQNLQIIFGKLVHTGLVTQRELEDRSNSSSDKFCQEVSAGDSAVQSYSPVTEKTGEICTISTSVLDSHAAHISHTDCVTNISGMDRKTSSDEPESEITTSSESLACIDPNEVSRQLEVIEEENTLFYSSIILVTIIDVLLFYADARMKNILIHSTIFFLYLTQRFAIFLGCTRRQKIILFTLVVFQFGIPVALLFLRKNANIRIDRLERLRYLLTYYQESFMKPPLEGLDAHIDGGPVSVTGIDAGKAINRLGKVVVWLLIVIFLMIGNDFIDRQIRSYISDHKLVFYAGTAVLLYLGLAAHIVWRCLVLGWNPRNASYAFLVLAIFLGYLGGFIHSNACLSRQGGRVSQLEIQYDRRAHPQELDPSEVVVSPRSLGSIKAQLVLETIVFRDMITDLKNSSNYFSWFLKLAGILSLFLSLVKAKALAPSFVIDPLKGVLRDEA
jgi:hypothetical protein